MFRLRPAFVFILSGLLCLCMTGGTPAKAAGFPVLEGPLLYAGGHQYDDGGYEVLLFLEKSGGFVLREHITLPNGKISSWDITGAWQQTGHGAFLELANNSSYERRMNVGSEGVLYLDARLPGGKQATVLLRQKRHEAPEFSLAGLLRVSGKRMSFKDPESNIRYTVLPGEPVNKYLEENPPGEGNSLPVRLTVTLPSPDKAPFNLAVLDISGVTAEKKWEGLEKEDAFHLLAAGKWRVVPKARELPPGDYWLAFFPEEGTEKGKVDIFDGKWFHHGSYTVNDVELAIAAPLMNRHFAWVIRQTRAWKRSGDQLELWGDQEMLAVLEKIL